LPKTEKHINRLLDALDKAQQRKPAKGHKPLPAVDFEALKAGLSVPQLALMEQNLKINLFLAGQGGGKTFMGGVVSAYMVQAFAPYKGLIAANTYAQLTGVTLFRIREVWKSFGWQEYNPYTGEGHYTVGVIPPDTFDTSRHNFDNYRSIISFCNGAVIHYYSLDNYKPIDGLEIGWAVLDETKDTPPAAITEVILGRLRQNQDSPNKLFVFTSPAKQPFLTEFFKLYDYESEIYAKIFSETEFFARATSPNTFVVICSAYHNQRNLPDNYIADRMALLPTHLHDMLIFGCPFARSGGEFYKGFDRNRHLARLVYDPDLPLHISFDFNVNPYITVCVWQIAGTEARQIGELCLANPRNNTAALCREFKRLYPAHRSGLFVYGDPSGRHADTRREKGYNDYTIIAHELKDYKPAMRVAVKAPAVVMRGNFINAIFEQNLYDISLCIDEGCKNTVADYTFVKEAADGTKHKERQTANGVSFELYGHTSDANDYFICEAFKEQFAKYLRGGETAKPWLMGLFKRSSERG
jgi:hypothetical protein